MSAWPLCRRVVAMPYPAELSAGSTRGHCGRPALAMPITLMTAPSVITPRNANQLRKAKQLSGTATASNKSWCMNPDEQAILIRQISGAVNGLQFRVQDLEETVVVDALASD